MNNIIEHIRNRRSVRTFDGKELAKNYIDKLTSFAQIIENPLKCSYYMPSLSALEQPGLAEL